MFITNEQHASFIYAISKYLNEHFEKTAEINHHTVVLPIYEFHARLTPSNIAHFVVTTNVTSRYLPWEIPVELPDCGDKIILISTSPRPIRVDTGCKDIRLVATNFEYQVFVNGVYKESIWLHFNTELLRKDKVSVSNRADYLQWYLSYRLRRAFIQGIVKELFDGKLTIRGLTFIYNNQRFFTMNERNIENLSGIHFPNVFPIFKSVDDLAGFLAKSNMALFGLKNNDGIKRKWGAKIIPPGAYENQCNTLIRLLHDKKMGHIDKHVAREILNPYFVMDSNMIVRCDNFCEAKEFSRRYLNGNIISRKTDLHDRELGKFMCSFYTLLCNVYQIESLNPMKIRFHINWVLSKRFKLIGDDGIDDILKMHLGHLKIVSYHENKANQLKLQANSSFGNNNVTANIDNAIAERKLVKSAIANEISEHEAKLGDIVEPIRPVLRQSKIDLGLKMGTVYSEQLVDDDTSRVLDEVPLPDLSSIIAELDIAGTYPDHIGRGFNRPVIVEFHEDPLLEYVELPDVVTDPNHHAQQEASVKFKPDGGDDLNLTDDNKDE